MAGRLLVLNAGSSSLKFKLFTMAQGALKAGVGGLVERIGDEANSKLVAKAASGEKVVAQTPMPDHVSAMERIMRFLSDQVSASAAKEVVAVGHRIVHGLDIHAAALLSEGVVDKIRQAAALAPLHNPPGLQGIQAAQRVFAGVPQVSGWGRWGGGGHRLQSCPSTLDCAGWLPIMALRGALQRRRHRNAACHLHQRMPTPVPDLQVAVFDTAYHQTMPPAAFMYGLPYELYERDHLRRYGFHGTSHR